MLINANIGSCSILAVIPKSVENTPNIADTYMNKKALWIAMVRFLALCAHIELFIEVPLRALWCRWRIPGKLSKESVSSSFLIIYSSPWVFRRIHQWEQRRHPIFMPIQTATYYNTQTLPDDNNFIHILIHEYHKRRYLPTSFFFSLNTKTQFTPDFIGDLSGSAYGENDSQFPAA